MSKLENMVGKRFGRLVVVSRGPSATGKSRAARWNCLCDCGKQALCLASNLKRGNSTSCGCFAAELSAAKIKGVQYDQTTHGMTNTSEYRSWCNMKQRCYNPNSINYHRYGGRGITVFPGWIDDFMAFYNHIGPKPKKNMTVDRINNNGNYEPGNVKWASRREQSINRNATTATPGAAKSGENRYRMSIDGFASPEEAHAAYLLALENLEKLRANSV